MVIISVVFFTTSLFITSTSFSFRIMKRTLLLLALVVGMAVAEEKEEGRADGKDNILLVSFRVLFSLLLRLLRGFCLPLVYMLRVKSHVLDVWIIFYFFFFFNCGC